MTTQIDKLKWDFYAIFRKELAPGALQGRRHWHCSICGWSNAFPNNAMYHARKKHPELTKDSDASSFPQSSAQNSLDAFVVHRPSDYSLRNVFDEQRYTDSIIGLLTRRRVPFSAVEWDEMKNIALACNPLIEDRLLTSRRRAMRIIELNFHLYQDQLRNLLEKSLSLIHLSTDLWTSPHRHGMIAICGQWVDGERNLRKALLGLLECPHSHSGDAQAALIMATIGRFGIKRIGYHIGDNATSNDTCLRSLAKRLETELDITFDPEKRRVRCIAHIINLSLQAFLLAHSKEAIGAALAAAAEAQDADVADSFTDGLAGSQAQSQQDDSVRRGKRAKSTAKLNMREYTGWQGIPALTKLHTIAVWLRSSAIHSDDWDACVGLRLGIDNATRWNSWFKVIGNALRKKSEIVQFLLTHDSELGDACLSGADWDILSKTHRFLAPFAAATLYAEGTLSSVSQTLPLMDVLLFHYEKAKTEHSNDPQMLRAIEMGWFVLDKYYAMTEEVPAYAAALLLDPTRRMAYIRQNWPSEWHQTAIRAAQELWSAEYKGLASPDEPTIPMPPPKRAKSNELSQLFGVVEVKKTARVERDDLLLFAEADPIEIDCTPLAWWCRSEQLAMYPRLSRMAIDILSIPAESAEPERVFSGARRTASWDRLKMSCASLERVECIGNWLREGLIKPEYDGGLGLAVGVGSGEDDGQIDPATTGDVEVSEDS